LRVLVIGAGGQVSLSLMERAPLQGAVVEALGLPELDFTHPAGIGPAVEAAARRLDADVLINAAAYTAVDKAEDEPETARLLNAAAPAELAAAAAQLHRPLLHISTDYVYGGRGTAPWTERDIPFPLNIYGDSKLLGDLAVQDIWPDSAILRTSWVYSPFGNNFVNTMLRLGGERSQLSVVNDQVGSPTSALDLADALLSVGRALVERPHDYRLRGVFHACGAGTTSWAGFARAVFAGSAARGGPAAGVIDIATADYPTRALRPLNSRLDTGKLAARHGLTLPPWQGSLSVVLDRLLNEPRDAMKIPDNSVSDSRPAGSAGAEAGRQRPRRPTATLTRPVPGQSTPEPAAPRPRGKVNGGSP
jgi:dTDP-4-dehydrorhamnose reductase